MRHTPGVQTARRAAPFCTAGHHIRGAEGGGREEGRPPCSTVMLGLDRHVVEGAKGGVTLLPAPVYGRSNASLTSTPACRPGAPHAVCIRCTLSIPEPCGLGYDRSRRRWTPNQAIAQGCGGVGGCFGPWPTRAPPPPPPHIHQKIVSFAESVISGRGPLGSPSTACLNIDPRPGAKTFGGLEGGGSGRGVHGSAGQPPGSPGGRGGQWVPQHTCLKMIPMTH